MIDPNSIFDNGWPFGIRTGVMMTTHTLWTIVYGMCPFIFVVFLAGISIGLILGMRGERKL